jgi:UDP-glucose 4-epimerase
MLAGKEPHIGTPEAVRDFIYVSDHTQAYIKAMGLDMGSAKERNENVEADPNYYAFNFGWGLQLRIRDIAEKLRKLTGYSGSIKTGFPPDYPNRVVTESYLSLDATKARKLLGWKPEYDIDAGLKKTVDYWKSAR